MSKFKEDDGKENLRLQTDGKSDAKRSDFSEARRSALSTKRRYFIDEEFCKTEVIWPYEKSQKIKEFDNIEWTRVNKIPTLSDDDGNNHLF